MAEELENGVTAEAAGAAGASPLLDLPEPLLLHWRNSLRSRVLARRPLPRPIHAQHHDAALAEQPPQRQARALDLSEFCCWTEDILPALAALT
jgi:hypothetical protein